MKKQRETNNNRKLLWWPSPILSAFLFKNMNPICKQSVSALSKDITLKAVSRQKNDSNAWQRGIQYVLATLLITYFKGKIETIFLECRLWLLEVHWYKQCTTAHSASSPFTSLDLSSLLGFPFKPLNAPLHIPEKWDSCYLHTSLWQSRSVLWRG